MSAVGHYLEDEGIPTVGISLVREHSEKMRPPRALWVPFMLGRPLGAPDAPDFQRQVLRAALELLEADGGPVLLRDFPHDAPATAGPAGDTEGLACPLASHAPAPDPSTPDGLRDALRAEVGQLAPWHDLAVRRRGASAFGLGGLPIERLADRLCEVLHRLEAGAPESPPPIAAGELKLACDDLRTYYEEAASGQPGGRDPDEVRSWIFGRTVAGRVLLRLRTQAKRSADPALRAVGASGLVPRSVVSPGS